MQYLDLWIGGKCHCLENPHSTWQKHQCTEVTAACHHVHGCMWQACLAKMHKKVIHSTVQWLSCSRAAHSSTLRCMLCFSVASKSNPQDELQWYVPFRSLFCYASGHLCPMLEQDASAHKEVWKTRKEHCYFMAFVWKLSFVFSCFSYVYLSSREHTYGQ